MKKLTLLFSALLALPLMVGCGGSKNENEYRTTDEDVRPYEVFEGEFFKAASESWYKSDDTALKEWYDTHDFTIYGTSPSIGRNVDVDTGVTIYGEIALIHSATNNYTYLGFHRSKLMDLRGNISKGDIHISYYEEIIQTDPKTHEEKAFKYEDGFLKENVNISESDYFRMFKNAIYRFIEIDPSYKEKYKKYMDANGNFEDYFLVQLQNETSLYSLFDYEAPKEYTHNGYAAMNSNPRTGLSYQYAKKENRVTVDFAVMNHRVNNTATRQSNLTKLKFEFDGDLPLGLTRHVDYYNNSDIHNAGNGYDIDIKFSYDELPNDPFTLLGQNFSYKDETHLLEWTENSFPKYYEGEYNLDVEEVKNQEYPSDFSTHDIYDFEVEVVDFGDSYTIKPGVKNSNKTFMGEYNYFYEIEDDAAKLIMCNARQGEINIPYMVSYRLEGAEEREKVPVVSIGKNVIESPFYVSDIYIPNTVEYIEKDAFKGLPEKATIHVQWDEKPDGWEDGWCPDYVQILYGQTFKSKIGIVKVDSVYLLESTVFGIKLKSGGYRYFKGTVIPKDDDYDWSDIVAIKVLFAPISDGYINLHIQNNARFSIVDNEFLIAPKQEGDDITLSFELNKPLERCFISFSKMVVIDEEGKETKVCSECRFGEIDKELKIHLSSEFGKKKMSAVKFYDLTVTSKQFSAQTTSITYDIQ